MDLAGTMLKTKIALRGRRAIFFLNFLCSSSFASRNVARLVATNGARHKHVSCSLMHHSTQHFAVVGPAVIFIQIRYSDKPKMGKKLKNIQERTLECSCRASLMYQGRYDVNYQRFWTKIWTSSRFEQIILDPSSPRQPSSW